MAMPVSSHRFSFLYCCSRIQWLLIRWWRRRSGSSPVVKEARGGGALRLKHGGEQSCSLLPSFYCEDSLLKNTGLQRGGGALLVIDIVCVSLFSLIFFSCRITEMSGSALVPHFNGCSEARVGTLCQVVPVVIAPLYRELGNVKHRTHATRSSHTRSHSLHLWRKGFQMM